MSNRKRQILDPSTFEDDETTRLAGLLYIVLPALFAVALVPMTLTSLFSRHNPNWLFAFGLSATVALSSVCLLFVVRRGAVRLASVMLLAILWAVITLRMVAVGTIRFPITGIYIVGILCAGLLLGSRGAFIFALVSTAATFAVFYAEVTNLTTPLSWPVTISQWLTYAVALILTAFLIRLTTRSLTHALASARQEIAEREYAEKELNQYRERLQELVQERTAELTAAIVQLEQEITHRQHVEEALRESEEKFRNIIESIPIGMHMYQLQPDGKLVFTGANPAADKILGIDNQQFVGQTIEEAFPAIKEAGVPERYRIAASTGEPWQTDEIIYKENEIAGAFEVRAFQTSPGRMAAAFVDITERKLAEEEIRRRNRELALLNKIITASASGLEPEAILDTACRELARTFDVPQAAAALINEDRTEASVVAEYLAEGRPSILDTIIPLKANLAFQDLLDNKAPSVVYNARSDPRLEPIHDLIRKRGTVSLLILPLVVEGKVIGGLGLDAIEPRTFSAEEVSLARNVADQVTGALAQARLQEQRKRLEDQYRQAQKMEAVGRLTAGIAHDFNNLLTAINGFAGLLRFELSSDAPRQELVEKILHSGQRAADLVRQLMTFSRKQIIEPQVLNLNTVVTDMNKMLRRIIGEDIELQTQLELRLWSVKVDPMQIGQVIANLAVNARDAMPAGGQLIIETANVVLDEDYTASHLEAQPGEHVLLVISDTGVGMSEEVKAHLFEPFFTTKELGKGTGLGLATVYGIVTQSGGHIWAYSEEGQGSAFKIYLPRVEKIAQATPRPRALIDVPSGDETILLVEDDESVRDLARNVLQSHGYTIIEARNGQEALSVAKHHPGPIHLLLTDVVMPGISGEQLAKQLTQARPDLKTLFMSGYTNNTIMHRGVLEPGIAFLQKPFSPTDLAGQVRQVLDTSQQTPGWPR